MQKPTVTVIVPIYNTEKEVERCLRSIARQTYANLQIIVVDDESPDRSPEIARQFCEKDPRFSMISKKNGGLSDARNFGFAKATGEYCTFIDADDEIEPTFIEKLLNSAKTYEADISICLVRIVHGESGQERTLSKAFKPGLENRAFDYKEIRDVLFQGGVAVWNKLFRTDFLRENKIQFKKGLHFEDIPHFAETMVKAKRVSLVNEALHKYYFMRPGSMTAKKGEEYLHFPQGLRHAQNILQTNGVYDEVKASFLDYKWERLLSAYVMIQKDLRPKLALLMREELAKDSGDMKALGRQIKFEG